MFLSELLLPRRPRLRTGLLSPTAPARPLHVAARSLAPKQKLHSHAGSWKLAVCETPNFQFPPLLAIPQCPWPAQRQTLCTRSTKLPLHKSQEQDEELQLRELSPHHSDWPHSSLVHQGSPCRGVCTARNSQGPCAWQVGRENKSWGEGIGRKHNLPRTVF